MSMERIGKYEILEEIGQGGFGTVYRGRDTVLKRMVAVKTCNSDEEEIRLRFQREAEVVASLQHPNITTVHDFGTHEGVPFLVQEYLSGEDLTDVIARKEKLSADTRVEYLVHAARGLGHAHQSGIVHRDVKPGNIRRLDDGSIKVMDFGIAKLTNLESKLTKTGTMLGTAAYLAPEQLSDGEIDQRCDIFSFGVLAYELLAYQRPFEGTTISALLYQVMSQEAVPLSEVWSECPEALDRCVAACLQKRADDRPSTFDEVIELLTTPENARTAQVTAGDVPTVLGVIPDLTNVQAGEDATVLVGPGNRPPVGAETVLAQPATTVAVPPAENSPTENSPTEVSRAFTQPSRGLLWAAIVFSVATLAVIFFFQRSLNDTSGEEMQIANQSQRGTLPNDAARNADEVQPDTSEAESAEIPAADPALGSASELAPKTGPSVAAASNRTPATSPQLSEAPLANISKDDGPSPAEQQAASQRVLRASAPTQSASETRTQPTPSAREIPRPAPADARRQQTLLAPDAGTPGTASPGTVGATPTTSAASANPSGSRAATTSATEPVAKESVVSPETTTPRTEPKLAERPLAAAVDEKAAVRKAIDRYSEAYEDLDAEALKRAWPTLTADQFGKIKRSFKSVQSQSMSLDNCLIEVQARTATAECTVRSEIKPKAGRAQSTTRKTTFQLRKTAGTWFVESM